jgi:hypothetical protein
MRIRTIQKTSQIAHVYTQDETKHFQSEISNH